MSLDFKFSADNVIEGGRTTRNDVDLIKDWLKISDEKNVPHNMQDELIVLFLLCLNNDIEATKKSIIAFYQLRVEAPDVFNERILEKDDLKLAVRTMNMVLIPTRTTNNDVILLFKLHDPNPKNFNVVALMKLCFMITDLTYHTNPPNGIILLVDASRFGFKHLARIKMDYLKKFFTFIQEALPLKLTGFHILNSNFVLRTLWSMIKVFIKDDILDKFFIHEPDAKQQQLFKHLPKNCLPKEYGGLLANVDVLQEMTLIKLKANQEFWIKEEVMRRKSV